MVCLLQWYCLVTRILEITCTHTHTLPLSPSLSLSHTHTDYISRRNLDQCSHHCLSQPDDILYTLNMGLPDGTSCLYTSDPSPSHSLQLSSVPESLGVCVSGECIPVGCNNTLRDIASRDVCGVWCGNGSTCVPVSDIYTIIEQNNNDTSKLII